MWAASGFLQLPVCVTLGSIVITFESILMHCQCVFPLVRNLGSSSLVPVHHPISVSLTACKMLAYLVTSLCGSVSHCRSVFKPFALTSSCSSFARLLPQIMFLNWEPFKHEKNQNCFSVRNFGARNDLCSLLADPLTSLCWFMNISDYTRTANWYSSSI